MGSVLYIQQANHQKRTERSGLCFYINTNKAGLDK